MDGLGTSVPGDRSLLSVFRPSGSGAGYTCATFFLPSASLGGVVKPWEKVFAR